MPNPLRLTIASVALLVSAACSRSSEQPALSDDDALAAAYAALGDMAPSGEIAFQGELGSPSARAVALPLPRASASAGDIRLREVQT